jgi:SAM-dependent methyltransferase
MPWDYETRYSSDLHDRAFLSWREAGARQKARNIVQVCHGINVQTAVEIGCGTGAVLRMLESMNFAQEYSCLDVAFSAVQFVQQSGRNLTFRAVVGSAGVLPFRDAAFDVAILSHVIEHLDDPASAMREAARIARHVVVEVPTERVLSNVIRTNLLGRPYASMADAGHVQFWSQRSIVTFLEEECGLQVLRRHRDPLSSETELYGKKGLQLAKPFFKAALKTVLPIPVYSRLLTTHATFLCCRPAVGARVSTPVVGHRRRVA